MFGLSHLIFDNIHLLAPIAAIIALLVAIYLARWIIDQEAGSKEMTEISNAIQEGALAFLIAEYKVLGIFVLVVAAILAIATFPLTAIAFITGAVLSALAGFVGMSIATRANVRTAQGASHGVEKALNVAFRSGMTTGLAVAGYGLLGLSLWALFLMYRAENLMGLQYGAEVMTGFLMGVSVVALFA
ncbi:MAG: sodium/proton-translocating pyrophosphatase, partial [Coriobacteriia bacterium]|nr:sodium/proton-translocating pyrophosphatase [Coriobacteriia bacterium]